MQAEQVMTVHIEDTSDVKIANKTVMMLA